MLNAADIVVLAVLALSVLIGLWRGLVSEIVSLVTWVAAFWAAWALGGQVAGFYAPWLDAPTARLLAGYLTCFIAVLVAGALLGWIARRALGAGGLRGGDRTLGGLFGLARGLVVVVVAVVLLGMAAVPREAGWWQGSLLLPRFESGAQWLIPRLPTSLAQPLDRSGAGLRALSYGPISGKQHAAGPRAAPAHSAATPAVTTLERATSHVHRRNDVGQ